MGIFDRFPYSSTHEMNLDFMLGKATEIAEDMQTVTTGMAQVQAGLSAISEKTEQATQAAAQAAQSASSIEGSVTAAEEAAEEAQRHNESAQTWANNAMTYKADCQRAASEAAASSSSAAQAATAAAASEDTVAQYAQAANASAQSAANNNDSAHQYANQASASASNATFHSSNAQTAATNAQTAATNANTSATNASASADRAASLKTDVETLHRMCAAAVDQAATEAVNAANSAAQAAATKTDVDTLVESLPEDFTDLNNTVNQLSDEIDGVKSTISVIDNNLTPIYADYYRYNVVDISEELQHGYYENGVYYANENYRAIKHNCTVGERYKISTYLRLVNHWAIVYFYNASNVLVAKYGGDADGTLTQDTYYENYKVEVPNGASYFVVSSYLVNGKPFKLAQWEEIDHSANYREVSFRYLENLNIQNGLYDHGTFYPNASYQTVKVSCAPGDVFKIDAYYYGAANQPVAQFYDSNMQLIGTTAQISETGQQNNVLVIIPDECAYVVFVNYIIADRVNFNIRKYINGEYPLFQKNYIALGDSITAIKDGWRPWFQKVTGANEILCTAVSGATLCDYNDTVVDGNPEATAHSNTLSNQVQSILNNPPSDTINFIVISAGTNDHASAAEFDGGVTQFVDHTTNTYIDVDTVDRTRYDGAMRWIAEKLWSQFPNADIFWCTPIQGAEGVRQTWVQIRKCDYMKEVASHLACPVIDATRNSGIYGRYETNNANGKYLIDGLHPNMYGRKKLGLFYASEIIDYYSYEID